MTINAQRIETMMAERGLTKKALDLYGTSWYCERCSTKVRKGDVEA